jgi:hypothetical protein
MYGSGNEPGTVADFEARIWRDYGKTLDEYIAYTTGKLINCKALALESYNTSSELIDTITLNLTTLTGINPTTGVRETIFPNGAGGGGSAYDTLSANTAVRKRNRIDLGSLTGWRWATSTSSVYIVFNDMMSANSGQSNLVCNRYWCNPIAKTSVAGIVDNEVRKVTNQIFLKDSDITSSDIVGGKITKLDGVILEYDIATPITYTDIQYSDGTPFVLPKNFEVQNDGTERITHAEGEDSIAPVMSAIYGLNAVGFVQDAPKDYTSQATLDSLTSLLSSLTGHTITKTWDAANNKWVFS